MTGPGPSLLQDGWLQSGRYAVYVAPAYAISALVLGAATAASLLRAARWRRRAAAAKPPR